MCVHVNIQIKFSFRKKEQTTISKRYKVKTNDEKYQKIIIYYLHNDVEKEIEQRVHHEEAE